MKKYQKARRRRRPTTATAAPLIVDLFCGVGGFSLGAARAGFRVHTSIDLDKFAIDAHKKNFPKSVHLNSDISKLSGSDIRKVANLKNQPIAGVIGGPPCQGFSSIGARDIADPRSLLFMHFFRLVSELKPNFFLAENVPGILMKSHDRLRADALALVDSDYVVLPPMAFRANAFGAPTIRKRVFFFGYKKSRLIPLVEKDFEPSKSLKPVTVGEALKGLPIRINPQWRTEKEGWRIVRKSATTHFAARLQGHIPRQVGDKYALKRLIKERRASGFWGTVHESDVVARFKLVAQGRVDSISRCVRLDRNGFCPTIRAGTDSSRGSFQAVRPLHPTAHRVITPREAARLQGFPDWFQFTPTRWHSFRQIGNSVSPLIAEQILRTIRRSIR